MRRILLLSLLLGITALAFSQVIDPAYERNLKKFTKEVDESIIVRNADQINTSGFDWAPVYFEDGIVYVSQYRSGLIDENSGFTYSDLFYAPLDQGGTPSKPQMFSVEVNKELNEGPVCFNSSQTKMYFTQNNNDGGITRENDQGDVVLKIYEAQKGYFDWERIRELPFNNDNFNCMHPSLSPDGTKLFFVSDMPEVGYGGYDIYFVQNINGSWSAPINLGPEVNTSKDEAFPMIHSSGTLFFASKGHKGFGDFDLYMIDMSTSEWGNVLNLGRPFNSKSDDFGISLTEDGRKGFFTSSRNGGLGKHDIYQFEAPDGIRGIHLESALHTKVMLTNEETGKPIANATVRYYEKSIDGLFNNKELYDVEIKPDPDNEDELFFKLKRKPEEDLPGIRYRTDESGLAVLPLSPGKEFIIMASKAGYTPVDTNYSTKTKGYVQAVEMTMRESNCMVLSGKVVSDPYRGTIFGANITIISSCDDPPQQVTSNIDGKFEACLTLGCDFTIIGEKEGFQSVETKISTIKIRNRRFATVDLELKPESEKSIREPIKKGTVIVFEEIYYDFNKTTIREGESRDLEILAELMKKYPSMIIELGAHSDSRGSSDYNQTLSYRRAEAAKLFLVKQGIASHRIKAFGYGENEIRNHCVDGVECDDEEHEYNRRTEVKILEINEPVEELLKSRGVGSNNGKH